MLEFNLRQLELIPAPRACILIPSAIVSALSENWVTWGTEHTMQHTDDI